MVNYSDYKHKRLATTQKVAYCSNCNIMINNLYLVDRQCNNCNNNQLKCITIILNDSSMNLAYATFNKYGIKRGQKS